MKSQLFFEKFHLLEKMSIKNCLFRYKNSITSSKGLTLTTNSFQLLEEFKIQQEIKLRQFCTQLNLNLARELIEIYQNFNVIQNVLFELAEGFFKKIYVTFVAPFASTNNCLVQFNSFPFQSLQSKCHFRCWLDLLNSLNLSKCSSLQQLRNWETTLKTASDVSRLIGSFKCQFLVCIERKTLSNVSVCASGTRSHENCCQLIQVQIHANNHFINLKSLSQSLMIRIWGKCSRYFGRPLS